MKTITQFYLLRCITNLHVGSGETNYGVIDKLIERDATSGFPCINSTGLKGAIKQKFEGCSGDVMRKVFGSDTAKNRKIEKTKGNKEDDTQQGDCQFLSARLLALPVRSDMVPFFLATSPSLICDFLQHWQDLIGNDHKASKELVKAYNLVLKATKYPNADLGQTGESVKEIITDNDFSSYLQALLGNTPHPIVILPDELMIELADDLNLPVIARNSLEDGQSNNLWYEQVLPRESLMYFPIIWDIDRSTEFNLTNGTLQVGGNASVGYGFTKISTLS